MIRMDWEESSFFRESSHSLLPLGPAEKVSYITDRRALGPSAQ